MKSAIGAGVTQSADDLYRTAMRLHQQGQPAEAGRLYDAVLAGDPRHYGALHLKGVLRLQDGDFAGAVVSQLQFQRDSHVAGARGSADGAAASRRRGGAWR